MLRARTRPLVGARMSRRPICARVAPSWASATRIRALAASRAARLRSRSALRQKPRPTSDWLRSNSFWASAASARATWTCAASWAAVCAWTERSMVASTWPWLTQVPASTSTARTIPPSPAIPTAWSRRAASAPEAVRTRATWLWPGTTMLTVGIWPRPPGAAAPVPPPCSSLLPPNMKKAISAAARTATAAIMIFRRRRERSTTTSVSELAKVVSRFIGRILPAIHRNKRQQSTLQALYYPNKSPHATALPAPPLKRLFLPTAAPVTRTRVVAIVKRACAS